MSEKRTLATLFLVVCVCAVTVMAQDTSGSSAAGQSSQPTTAPQQAPTAPYSTQAPTGFGVPQQGPPQQGNPQQGLQPQNNTQPQIPSEQTTDNNAPTDQFTLSMPGSGSCTYDGEGRLVTTARFGEQPPQNAANCPLMVPVPESMRRSRRRGGSAMGTIAGGQPNSFQVFVTESLGHELPMFGSDLFSAPSTFAPINSVPVPEDYVIGPGDQLKIHIWGQLEFNQDTTVDQTGAIYMPKIGPVMVSGLHASQLAPRLREALSRSFKNFDLTASVGDIRGVQVYVLGFARTPGVFTVSSLSTLLNAIFASGGPSSSGSMRNIELRRGGKTIQTFDLYDLLLRGDLSHDTKLEAGDVIYFNPIGRMVAIPDEVKVPAIYELKGDMTVKQIIDQAGGFATTAYTHELTVESIDHQKDRRVERFALDDAGLQRNVRDGDILLLGPVSPRFENAVTLRGNVARAGRYPYKPGMRIHDLIPTWQSLIAPEYWNRLNRSSGKISEFGIRNDVRFERADINWDYALVQRLDQQKLSTILLTFDLGKAVIDHDPTQDIEVQPGDIVTIFSQTDLQVPFSKRARFVTVEGEFKAAGIYRLQGDETLPQLIQRVGGLTEEAYLPTLELTRDSILEKQKRDLNAFVTRMESDIQQTDVSSTETTDEGRQRRSNQRRLLEQLRMLEPSGRLSLNIRDNTSVIPPVLLHDGDRIRISTQPATVSVVGMVYNAGDFLYNKKASLHDYLKFAGGETRTADHSKLYVVGVNGDARLVSKSLFRGDPAGQLRPGDTVIIPSQVNPGQFVRDLREWTAILSQFGIAAAAVKVLSQ